MTCKHCALPIRRCIDRGYPGHGPDCKGWRHTRTARHLCERPVSREAEPEVTP